MSKFEEGLIVICTAPDFFKGKRLGVIKKSCKHHDGGWIVELVTRELDNHGNTTMAVVCVQPNKGDLLLVPERSIDKSSE